MDWVGKVWYLIETFELIDGYWHPVKEHSAGVGFWPEGEEYHIFRAVAYHKDGKRSRYFRVYPNNREEFYALVQTKSKIYKDGEGNIFF